MPCWVAPVVAAELWGVSLGHVLGAIADGTIPSHQEYGFTLVDVAPDGALPQTPCPRQGPPPPTYVVMSDEGAADGMTTSDDLPATEPADAPQPVAPVPWAIDEVPPVPAPAELPPIFEDELPPLDEEEDDKPISHWRQVRSSMGRMRKPPARIPPAAFAA